MCAPSIAAKIVVVVALLGDKVSVDVLDNRVTTVLDVEGTVYVLNVKMTVDVPDNKMTVVLDDKVTVDVLDDMVTARTFHVGSAMSGDPTRWPDTPTRHGRKKPTSLTRHEQNSY